MQVFWGLSSPRLSHARRSVIPAKTGLQSLGNVEDHVVDKHARVVESQVDDRQQLIERRPFW
jgi:hypothetical protein